MCVTLPKGSSAQKRRIMVAVAEIQGDGELASLRRHLPNAAVFELHRAPGDLKASVDQIARILAKAEDRLVSCVTDGPPLPPRQLRILTLIVEGRTNKEIGRILDLSPFTIRNHISLLFRLLNVRTRAEAVAIAGQFADKG